MVNKVLQGDCLDVMKTLEDNSIDSIVTDPPYELGFMGKHWDNKGIAYSVEMWAEALRVLKPGGYLLSFGGTRTYHRMTCAIEDAGFEIRDCIMWLYGSGFPKSLNIGKAVDKISPRLGQFDKFAEHFTEQIKASGKSQKEISKLFPSKTGGITGCVWNWANGANVPTIEQWNILKPLLDLSDEFLPLIERIERERVFLGKYKTEMGGLGGERLGASGGDITKGTSEWEGWGTALKPAVEPIVVARKPLSEKNVSLNVLKWGTGGINIDGSRVGHDEELSVGFMKTNREKGLSSVNYGGEKDNRIADWKSTQGRFPANLIHDGSDEVVSGFPNDSQRFFYCAKASRSERNMGLEGFEEKERRAYSGAVTSDPRMKHEQNRLPAKNNHPTVKPLKLMEYLVKLVTPPKGVCLDPFLGSGTTAMACKSQGFNYIGIEQDGEYVKIAEARIKAVIVQNKLW